jgi:hypothetical protein
MRRAALFVAVCLAFAPVAFSAEKWGQLPYSGSGLDCVIVQVPPAG